MFVILYHLDKPDNNLLFKKGCSKSRVSCMASSTEKDKSYQFVILSRRVQGNEGDHQVSPSNNGISRESNGSQACRRVFNRLFASLFLLKGV